MFRYLKGSIRNWICRVKLELDYYGRESGVKGGRPDGLRMALFKEDTVNSSLIQDKHKWK
jgi:hypothetical protein